MALRPKNIFLTIFILLFTLTAVSCMKIRGPGIMPAIEESMGGEWVVVRESTKPARTDSGEQRLQWRITLQYVAGEGDRRVASDDIRLTFDGNPIPFTFKEEDQILETTVTTVFGPPVVHFFVLDTSEDSNMLFPSFELVIR
jgi:hypothetical protein